VFKPNYQIDIDWLYKISYKLERFKKSSPSGNTFVCRCIICGDSAKSKKTARLFFYTKKGSLNYDCKNCGDHGSFYSFMRDVCPQDFEEYKKQQLLDRFQSRSSGHKSKAHINLPPKEEDTNTNDLSESLVGCVRLDKLPKDHPAVLYVLGRQIPDYNLHRLFYADNFRVTAQSIAYEELSPKFPDEPRIVIPFYSKDGLIEMIQGRSLDKQSKLRYISIKSSEGVDKIYGKEKIDNSKTTYCVEGPFDSLFIDNCVATCDSALQRSNANVLIFDNQPRNKEIIELMDTAISNGRSVVIWPVSPNDKIDINDMILMGLSQEQLMNIIQTNTFSGLKAKLMFTKWKKV